jgi:hypothetical protein
MRLKRSSTYTDYTEFMIGTENDIANRLDGLFSVCLKVSNPISSLLIMRSKIVLRGFIPCDEYDILTELGALQHVVGEIHREMLCVEEIVRRNK